MPSGFDLSKQDATDDPRIVTKRYLYNGEFYDICKYDKDLLTHDDCHGAGRYRSVVFKGQELVVVSPSKSLQFQAFVEKHPLDTTVVSEEIVEGTMINLFLNPDVDDEGRAVKDANGALAGKVDIATRSTVGANVSFYQDDGAPTFRRMFLEACNEADFDFDHLRFSDNEGTYCYSLVLQHPANRIVKPITKSSVHLVALCRISHKLGGEGEQDYSITNMDYRDEATRGYLGLDKCRLSYPTRVEYDSYERAKADCDGMGMDYPIPGVMFHSAETGDRCKCRNGAYEEVRCLRGNQPRLQYQYLVLRQKGKVKEFLKYYPEKAKECASHRRLVHNFTQSLHANYTACYVRKERPLLEFPKQHRGHMYKLHQLYIQRYRAKKGYIGMAVVLDYVNTMPVSHLMHALNYNLKRRHAETTANSLVNERESHSPEAQV